MNALDLLARLRRRTSPAASRADDHGAVATHTADPSRCDEITRPAPKPPEPSPAPEPAPRPVGPAWPSPRTWLNATVTEIDRAREDRQLARLAALTDQLGSPLAAAQHLYAPHLRKDQP